MERGISEQEAKAIEEEASKRKEQKATKVKVSKKEREEYATIEADVEALEVAAAGAGWAGVLSVSAHSLR